MNSIVAHLEDLDRSLAEAGRDVFDREEIPDLSDAEIAALLEASGRIQKRIEALQIEASVQVLERSAPMRDDRITAKYGWDWPVDLVRALTRTETRDANRVVKAARLTSRIRGMSSGEFVPARYPELRAAMLSGAIGVAGLLAAIEPLEQSRDRMFDEDRLEADRQLADLARGTIRDDEGRAVDSGPLPRPRISGSFRASSSPTSTPTAPSRPTAPGREPEASSSGASATAVFRSAATSFPKWPGNCNCCRTASSTRASTDRTTRPPACTSKTAPTTS